MESEGVEKYDSRTVQFDIFKGVHLDMIFYLIFTAAWTFIVIAQSSLWRRINRFSIMPIERQLSDRGVPEVLQKVVTGLLQLSIIPLGFVWASILMLRSLRAV